MEQKLLRFKIYKLIGKDGKIFIGATTHNLSDLVRDLGAGFRRYSKGGKNFFTRAFRVFECGTYPTFNLIEEYVCNSKKECNLRKKYYINTIDCVNKEKRNKANNKRLVVPSH